MLIRSVLFNFQGAFLNSVFLISQTTLLLYHIFSSLSRGFSNFFQSFFQTILVLTFSLSLCPHLECLSIISPSPAKVNTFLKSFFHSLLMSYIFNCFSTIHSNMHCCTPFFYTLLLTLLALFHKQLNLFYIILHKFS